MVEVIFAESFRRKLKKIKDNSFKEKIKKQIEKIINSPEIGKPMMYARKSTREIYVSPFRISYNYVLSTQTITFLDLYHKDEQ